MHHISLLFTLPTLACLVLPTLALPDDDLSSVSTDQWLCKPKASSIELLTVRGRLPADCIAMMIESCRTLMVFHHLHSDFIGLVPYYPRIFQALDLHKDTIKYLRMVNFCIGNQFATQQGELAKRISFLAYIALIRLIIPSFHLALRAQDRPIRHLLPAQLQGLTVEVRSKGDGFCDGFFISLAEAARTYVLSLEFVEVICCIDEYNKNGSLPLHLCHLRRMFASRGIEFTYSLNFATCEFQACKPFPATYIPKQLLIT
jgi:hypothetical protein